MKLALFLSLGFISSFAFAVPSFTSITDTDFNDIAKEASANFTHNSMIGAAKLGTVFGFQVGLTGAQTASPKTNDIVKRNAGSELPNLYNAGIIAAVGVPFGISAESVVVPKLSASGADLSSTSLALKWNINDVVPVLPLNLALRGVYSTAKFSFSQVISGLTATVENKTTVSGVQLLVSPMMPMFEPYAGIGMLTGSNELSVSGTTGTIFNSSFSTSQSEKKSVSGTQILVGAEMSLALLKIGAEYSQAFGTSRIGIKFGLGF